MPVPLSRPRRPRVLVAAVTACAALAAGCSSSGGGGRATPPPGTTRHRSGAGVEFVSHVSPATVDAAAAAPVARAEEQFSLDLLRRVTAGNQDDVTVSPASLAEALAMLQNGAGGRTLEQISRTLGPRLTTTRQNAGWQALAAGWARAATDNSFDLSTANAAWLQRGFPVRTPFLDSLKRYYDCGVWQADYQQHAPEAVRTINAWTREQTKGKITKLFDRLDPSTRLVLADAVYFKAAWAAPFAARQTRKQRFTPASGPAISTPFMHNDVPQSAAVTSDYAAVELPYRGGRFAALAVMPRAGSLASFVASLSVDSLHRIVSSLHTGPVDLAMPRFTTTSTLDLGDTLSALGMPQAFRDGADFSRLSPKPVVVQKVVQRDYLAVAEKGTEAAAVTGIGITAGAVPRSSLQVTLNHPFLFLIRDTRTGAILFASQVANPAA